LKELAFARSSVLSPTDYSFYVRAIEIQLRRDFYPAWKHYLPLGELPVIGYASMADYDQTKGHVITVVDSVEDPRLAGYHTGVQALGYAFGRSLPESRVMSHEALELVADPFCNLYSYDEDDGVWFAREVCDPVERDTYSVDVELFGVHRAVIVSSFVYPAWFGMINHGGDSRFDHLDLCERPFEVRAGYAITKDETNNIKNIYGSMADTQRGSAKLTDPFSRTARR
jgi:hypothetical protein